MIVHNTRDLSVRSYTKGASDHDWINMSSPTQRTRTEVTLFEHLHRLGQKSAELLILPKCESGSIGSDSRLPTQRTLNLRSPSKSTSAGWVKKTVELRILPPQ